MVLTGNGRGRQHRFVDAGPVLSPTFISDTLMAEMRRLTIILDFLFILLLSLCLSLWTRGFIYTTSFSINVTAAERKHLQSNLYQPF